MLGGASPLAGAQACRSPRIQGGSPFERTILYYSHVPLRHPQPHRRLAGRQPQQETAGEDLSLTLWQGLKQTLYALSWPAIQPKRVTFNRTFPARFLQDFQ